MPQPTISQPSRILIQRGLTMVNPTTHNTLTTVQPEEFLPPMGQWVKFGGLIIIGTFGCAIAYSAIAPYKVTIKGQAVIRPTGELRIVQAAAEGKILKITASENQVVRKGDRIAQIDDSQLQTKQKQLQTNIQQTQLQVLQVNAQIQALDRQITAEADRRDRVIISSQAELTKQLRDHEDRKTTAIASVAEAEAKLQAARSALQASQLRWNRYKPLADSGALSKDELEKTQLTVDQQEQEVVAAMAGVQHAATALDPSNAAVLIASAQIDQEQASGAGSIANFQKEKEALIQQRIQMQNQLAHDQQDVRQAELDLAKTTITATADGIITSLNLRNVDQTVAAGQEIAKIVPSGAKLRIKTFIAASDLDKVKLGQTAQMRVSACPYPDYGTLHGTVRSISPDAIAPANQTATGEASKTSPATASPPVYEVTIEPKHLSLKQGGQECRIQMGMEGKIDIISRQETVLRWLLRKARFLTEI
jgi:HlyD family type I secretion membrane fusion protein